MLHVQFEILQACKALSVDFKLGLMKFLEANILKDRKGGPNFFFFFEFSYLLFSTKSWKNPRRCGLFLINTPSEYAAEAQIWQRYLAEKLLGRQVVQISASWSVMHEVCGRTRSTVKIIGLLAIL